MTHPAGSVTPCWGELAQTRVICDIGQLTPADTKALAKLVRQGVIAKWRGYYAPIAGASFGLGPLKTCYGPVGAQECLP